jgi:two-component system, NarL family, response regulator NreC
VTAVRTRIVIVDDHVLLRRGLGLLFAGERDLEVVGEAGTVADALTEVDAAQPDVIVLDIHLPDGSGIGAIRTLLERSPGSAIVMLSMYDDFDHVRRAFAEGAVGYVLKSSDQDELVAAIRSARSGECYRGRGVPDPASPRTPDRPMSTLSPRELEVLRLLVLGNTNHEIADALVVSVKTVETHRAHIMRKLKADSRAALVRQALAAGLLGPD